jgi:hypothetical protein
MPKDDEVQAVLDVLFNHKTLRWEYELHMWHEAKTFQKNNPEPWDFLLRKTPERMFVMWAKYRFDEDFKDIVYEALEQAEKVRKGKKAIDIFPVNAHAVRIDRNKWGVELFMGAAGAELIEGFKDPYEAGAWIREKAEQYVVSKGLPKGTKVRRVE